MKHAIRHIAVSLGLAAACLSLAPSAYAQRREPQTMANVLPMGQARMVGDIKILNVRNNVWVLIEPGGANITALLFPEGITLVDSGTDANADKVLAALATMTNQKVTYVINTSAKADHTGGNLKMFKAGHQITGGNVVGTDPDAAQNAEIIGHENVLNRMVAMKAIGDATPATTYYTPILKLSTLYHGDAIELLHEPNAVTDGDTVVWFRGNDILATGDVFTASNYPELDPDHGGSINGELAAVNHVLETAFPEFRSENGTLIVPGHGRLCDFADVAYFRDMLTIIRDRVQDSMGKRMTLDQIKAKKLTRDYDGYFVADAARYSPDQFVEAVYKSLQMTAAKNAPAAKALAPAAAKPAPAAKK
jgi:glyoxylase-like metal-dependent hydrolase (beta-lactamase superfamily II)